MASCKCDVSLGNTGLPSCQPIANVASKIFYFQTYADDGSRNGIDTTVTLDQAYLDSLINHADGSKRFYPLPKMENVTSVRAESAFEESPAGTKAFIKEGTKSFFGEMWKQSPAFLGQLKGARCTDISVLVLDIDGNIIGSCDDGGTTLYGIKVDKNSWEPLLVESTDTTVQKVSLGFDFDSTAKDEDLRMIVADEYTADFESANGLLDVNAVYSLVSTTGFTATLSTIYGSKITPIKDTGLVAGDFSLFNNTTSLPVVITSVTESANGVYDFVIPTQTSADELVLTPSKDGRDYANVIATIITIP